MKETEHEKMAKRVTAAYMRSHGKEDSTEVTIYIRGFPKDLAKIAKMQALKEETTLKGIVIKALTEYLEKVGGVI